MHFNKRVWISSVLFVISLVLRIIVGPHWFMLFLVAYVGIPIIIQAFKNLRYKIIGIDLLVSIAILGACILGDYWEASAVAYLFYIGNEIERYALSKTRNTLRSLIASIPDDVRVLINNEEQLRSQNDVEVGDHVLVKSGEMIPVDGLVLSGQASVNQASITGESLPIDKNLNDEVYAGTTLTDGYLIIKVTTTSESTIYSGIIQYIEEAQDNKTQTQIMIDRFAKYYTPLVMLLSLGTLFFTKDLRIALSLLVVSCPGALVIATPITIVSGIGSAGKRGILIKSGQVFEDLTRADRFVFDKTGTLTHGELEVVDIITKEHSKETILKLAAIGERYSEHPIGLAIIEAYGKIPPEAEHTEIVQGKGIQFRYNDTSYQIGNAAMFEGLELPSMNFEAIAVYLGTQTEIYGMILLSDTLRDNISEEIQHFPKSTMLTGDRKEVAQAIARKAGIQEVHANMLPQDKANFIKEHQSQECIVMVGDGVNDAPAIAQADVGISVGGTSHSIAMETSDVILMDGILDTLLDTYTLSKRVMRIMKQNLIISILTAIVLMLGVLGSYVSLSVGMLVHELTIFIVIGNAFRLIKKRG